MKKKIISILAGAVLVLNLVPTAMASGETTLYVSPNGSDSAAGTVDAPLATMDGARKKVLELKAAGTAVREVIFAEGDYYQRKVAFTAEDSGTDGVITYKAADGAEVTFKGSKKLSPTTVRKFSQSTDAEVYNRVYNSVQDKLYVIDLAANGLTKDNICDPVGVNGLYSLTNWGEYNPLIINGVAATVAQWPNGEQFATWVEGLRVEEESYKNDKGEYAKKAIRYSGDNPDRWANAKKWWVTAYPAYNFTQIRTSVAALDAENNIIKFPANTVYEFTGETSKRWKAFNLIEEIDLPGEYYIDRDKMLLYIYPDCDLSTAKIELAIENQNLVTVVGAKDITFEGLNFSQSCRGGVTTSATTVDGVTTSINNVDFINCSFTDIGTRGLGIVGGTDVVTGADYWQEAYVSNDASYNVDIRGCNFERIGGEALVVHGGNVDTLTDSGNIVEDNYITLATQNYFSNGSAVMVTGCGNVFRNNHIHRLGYQAVLLSGNNHLIEGNEIYDCMRITGDGAGIYQGRNQLYRGSEITKNYVHDLSAIESLYGGACGIYMDDGQQGNKVTQNIVVNVGNGYNSNYAMAMTVQNNTFVNCNKPWAFHNPPSTHQGTWWILDQKYYMKNSSMESTSTGELFTTENLMDQVANPEIYLKEYPQLKEWIETGLHPLYQTVISGNLAIGSKFGSASSREKSLSTWSQTEGVSNDNRQYTATSEFVDAKNHDYRLKSNLYLAKSMPGLLNDKNCDINDIGLKTKRILNAETAPYRILSPADGETFDVKNSELYWQEATGANTYLLEISTDSKFNRIVYSKTLRTNIAKVSDYDFTDGRTYYWRVTATNISKDLGATWFNENAKGKFIAEVK